RVVERAQDARLAGEAQRRLFVAVGDELERDGVAGREIPGAVDLGHAAFADERFDLEALGDPHLPHPSPARVRLPTPWPELRTAPASSMRTPPSVRRAAISFQSALVASGPFSSSSSFSGMK